jgi:FkbM family methyltransferase
MDTDIVEFNGFKIEYHVKDYLGSGSIAKNKAWEPHITSFVKKVKEYLGLKNIIDIGANFGYHTLFFAKEVEGTVYAFEPQQQNFTLLSNNIKHNDIRNITAYYLACGDIECDVTMPLFKQDSSMVNMGDITPNITGSNYTVTKSVPLDTMSFPHIDLIKIDVQGWEKKVLLGSTRLLQEHKPILIIEFEHFQLAKTNTTCEDLFAYIRANNYYIFYLDYEYPSDHICVHNDNLEEFTTMFAKHIFPHTADNDVNHNINYGVNQRIVIQPSS